MDPKDRTAEAARCAHTDDTSGTRSTNSKRRSRLVLAGLIASICIAGGGLSLAQADQLPTPPPVPSPPSSGSDNGDPDGYPDATAGQAENLFTNDFSDTVDSLAQDPPDLSGEHPRFLNDKTAVISSSAQKSPAELSDAVQQILDRDRHDLAAARSDLNDLFDAQNAADPKLVSSTMPLRAPADNGQQAPLDLSLDAQGSNYVPGNPIVDLKLPANLTNDVAVGDQGIKVDVGATQSSTADPITGDDNLFYHEAATDTDVVLAPVSVGLEAFYQLRSPDSPEHFQMSFTLPAGASLQAADGEAAQIVKGGQTIAVIPTPSASDAAGDPVPLTTSVNGNSLKLSVAHQDADVSYPINVDPVIDTYIGTNGNIADFTANWSQFQPSGSYYALGSTCTQNISCTSGTTGPVGLYINATPNHTYTSGQAAGWLYQVPHSPTSTAYISSMTLGAMNFHLHSGSATTPYLAAGIFAASSFSWLDYKTRSTTADGLYWDFTAPSNQTTAATGKTAAFEVYSSATQNLGNWRDAYLGYASINLADTDNPTESIDTSPLTSGWIDGTQTKTFPVNVSDGGVGAAGLWGPGPNGNDTQTFKNSGADCTGTRVNPCPQSGQLTAGYYPGKTPEGQSTSAVWGWDAFGKVAGQTWNVKVDGSPPTISTSGGLAEQPNGDSSPYKLTVDATDQAQGGATSDPATWRSGVKQIDVYVNGDKVPDSGVSHDCTADHWSCPLSYSYSPNPSDLTTNNVHFKVIATDELGHSTDKQWDVSLPDTSIDSGPSAPTNDSTPTFSYSSPAPNASFECRVDDEPYSACSTIGYTSQPLVDGQHTFVVRAVNNSGHVDASPASRTVTIDQFGPETVIDTGPESETTSQAATLTFASADGGVTFECSFDDDDWSPCASPFTVTDLATGQHSLAVRATDVATNVDSTPAQHVWSVVPEQPIQDADDPSLGEPEEPSDPLTIDGFTLDPSWHESADVLHAEGTIAPSVASTDYTDGTTVGSGSNAVALVPLDANSEAPPSEVVEGDSAVYSDTAEDVTTVLRPSVLGIRVFEQIDSGEAPETYSWQLHLGADQELVPLPDGGAAVTQALPGTPDYEDGEEDETGANPIPNAPDEIVSDEEPGDVIDPGDSQAEYAEADQATTGAWQALDSPVAVVFEPPTAIDATGHSVEVQLSTNANVLTLTVAHRPGQSSYPVVAAASVANSASLDMNLLCLQELAGVPGGARAACNNPDVDADDSVGPDELTVEDFFSDEPPEVQAAWAEAQSYGAGEPVYQQAPSGVPGVHVNRFELHWCKHHALLCGSYLHVRALALHLYARLYTGPIKYSDGTKANAFLHSFWMSAMIHTAPKARHHALVLAMAHEGNGPKAHSPNKRKSSRMDVINNRYSFWQTDRVRAREWDDRHFCQFWRDRVEHDAVHIGPDPDPFKWRRRHGYATVYRFRRLQAAPWSVVHQSGAGCQW